MLAALKIPALALLGCVTTTALLAAVVTFRGGAVYVSVQEKDRGGSHVRVIVPAALVPVAMNFVPARKFREHMKDNGQWLPLAGVVSREMEKCPDATLVEVTSPKERVHIQKRGDSIVVDVDDPEETVHVSFPARALRSVVEKLEASEPPA